MVIVRSEIRLVLLGLAVIPAIAAAQSSLDLLKNSSDAGQQVFDQRSGPSIKDTTVFLPSQVDQQPEFPGGGKAMFDHMVAARGCTRNEIQDDCWQHSKVVTEFVVEPDGRLTGQRIVKGGCEALEGLTLCAISRMPSWTPGRLHGVPVRVRMSVPMIYEPH